MAAVSSFFGGMRSAVVGPPASTPSENRYTTQTAVNLLAFMALALTLHFFSNCGIRYLMGAAFISATLYDSTRFHLHRCPSVTLAGRVLSIGLVNYITSWTVPLDQRNLTNLVLFKFSIIQIVICVIVTYALPSNPIFTGVYGEKQRLQEKCDELEKENAELKKKLDGHKNDSPTRK